MFDLKPRRDDDDRLDLFNRVFQPFNDLIDQGTSALDSRLASFKADVKKVDNKYVVEAELPGFKKDEISIKYEENYLTIHAEKRTEEEIKEEGKLIRRERHTGEVIRRFYVSDVNKDMIKAELDDGVLSIEMPIKETAKAHSKNIEIE